MQVQRFDAVYDVALRLAEDEKNVAEAVTLNTDKWNIMAILNFDYGKDGEKDLVCKHCGREIVNLCFLEEKNPINVYCPRHVDYAGKNAGLFCMICSVDQMISRFQAAKKDVDEWKQTEGKDKEASNKKQKMELIQMN
jgi:hypothetical protein